MPLLLDECLLCGSQDTQLYFEDKRRAYFECSACHLVFVPKSFHLDEHQEKSEYDLHENMPDDIAYRHFLSRLALPIFERYRGTLNSDEKHSLTHLDFGCGPGPALSCMFKEQGFKGDVFDVFYSNDPTVLKLRPCDLDGRYDVITLTEVIEHLSQPSLELSKLWTLLKPGGVMGIMTKLVSSQSAFKQWHYKNDPTHIAFYSLQCLELLSVSLGAQLCVLGKDAFLLIKTQ
ncbi:MAG: class I SAM-dependent methyltransferase [Sinobacterium sp.]|nr:class I SAM-dependent methyltransferase [Sinobacterium sp.]